MRRPAPPLGFVLAIAGASMFAWLGPLSRWSYAAGIEPLPFVAWRAGVGALVLALVVAVRAGVDSGRPAEATVPPRRTASRELATLAVATLVGLVLNLAIFGAFSRVTVALALLAFYTYPAMVAVAAVLLGRERRSRVTLLALLLALGGMAVVVAGSVDPAAGIVVDAVGLALALTAAASQTVFVTISRSGYRSIPTDRAMAVILGGTLFGCVAIAVATGGAAALTRPLAVPSVLPILLVAGTLGAAIPSLFFLGAIRLIGGTRTGILMLFEPVVAVTLAAILLGEALRPIQVVGAAAILAAAVLIQRSPREAAAGRRAVRERAELADDATDIVAARIAGGP